MLCLKRRRACQGPRTGRARGLRAACGVNREVTVSTPEKGRSEQGQEGSGRAVHEYLGRRLSGAKPLSKECAMQAEKSRAPAGWCGVSEGKREVREGTQERQGPL